MYVTKGGTPPQILFLGSRQFCRAEVFGTINKIVVDKERE
jgi:hypothetical protein